MKIKNKLLKTCAFCAAIFLLASAYQTIASMSIDPIGRFIFKNKAVKYVTSTYTDTSYKLTKTSQYPGLWEFEFEFEGDNSLDKRFWLVYSNGKLIDDSYPRMVTELRNTQNRLIYEVTQDALEILQAADDYFYNIANGGEPGYIVNYENGIVGHIFILYGSELADEDTIKNPAPFKDKLYVDMPYNRNEINVPLEMEVHIMAEHANASIAAPLLRKIDEILTANNINIARYTIAIMSNDMTESFTCNRINAEDLYKDDIEAILDNNKVPRLKDR